MREASIPGLAVGISRGGSVVFTQRFGFADISAQRAITRASMFHIASITKTVTALAILRLVDKRLIALEDPIAPHLDFALVGDRSNDITFRHLLMHTSGISDARYYEIDFRNPGHDAGLAIGDLLKSYLATGGRYTGGGNLKTEPGAVWDYSNIGYGLLGYLGSRIAGRDLRDVTRDEIFRPLNLHHTSWSIADTPEKLRVTPYDVIDGKISAVEPVGLPDWSAGNIRASIGDLTRLVAIAANNGMVDGKRIVSAQAMRAMLDMRQPAGLPDWLTGQGLAWQQAPLAGVPLVNHWGGDPGVFTMAYVDPRRRLGVALLSNVSATPASRNAMKAIAVQTLAAAT